MLVSKSVVLVALAVASAAASPQSSKQSAGVVGRALSEWADKQIDANLEIELARKKAEIEVEKQRQLQELRQAQGGQARQANGEGEEAKLRAKHPQWAYIVVSPAFKSWIEARPAVRQQECMRTQLASVMAGCIEDFFQTAVFRPQ